MTETKLFEGLSIYAAGALVLTVMSKFLGYDQQYLFMITGVGYVALVVACGAACMRRESRDHKCQLAILRVGAFLNLLAGGVALAHWFAVVPGGASSFAALTTDSCVVGGALVAQAVIAAIAVVFALRAAPRRAIGALASSVKS